jgi:hypothetical protein
MRPTRYRQALIGVTLAFAWIGCKDEETVARERLAGDYEIHHTSKYFYVRQILTLRSDGTWRRVRLTNPQTRPSEPDSGTYRVVGVTINLRSLAQGGGPTRYTVVGDTLFGANAAEMVRLSGYDTGEERLVRVR